MMVPENYRKLATRQRPIAAAVPLLLFKERFLASAERYETLAKTTEELGVAAPHELGES